MNNSLALLRETVLSYGENIDTNYRSLKGMVDALKQNVAESVEAALSASMDAAFPNVETETVELDTAWWEEHAAELGWVKDENGRYCYTDPDTGKTYRYNPKNHYLYVDGSGQVKCRLYLNGDPSNVTETVTLLKSYVGDEPRVGDKSTKSQLIIAPELSGDESDDGNTAKLALMSSKFGDAFLKSAGNDNDIKRNLCGFSMGGVQAMKMVSGRLGNQYVGYYDKVTLVNISPGTTVKYTPEQVQNMRGLEFDIVTNYNNVLGVNNNRRDGNLDFCSDQMGGPHLDKLAGIPGAKVNLILPDLSNDTHGSVARLSAYAEGLGLDNVTVSYYPVDPSDLAAYGSGTRDSSHENGRRILLPRYLAGDLEPIE